MKSLQNLCYGAVGPMLAVLVAALGWGQAHAQPASAIPMPYASATSPGAPPSKQIMDMLPAEKVDAAAVHQFEQFKAVAAEQKALAPPTHPQQMRVDAQFKRLLALDLKAYLPRAAGWQWEAALVGRSEADMLAWPGGKLMVYFGLLNTLSLTDDELASALAIKVAGLLLDQQRELLVRQQMLRAGLDAMASMTGASAPRPGSVVNLNLLPVRRNHQLSADALARKLLDDAGVPVAAQLSFIERSMADIAPAASASAPSGGVFGAIRLEDRLAAVRAAAR